MNRRVYGYLRVSKADRNRDTSLGIEAQQAKIERHAELKGWEVVGWFIDNGVSGKDTDRPGLQALLSALSARPKVREADGVVAAKLDRLSRSVVDFGALLEASRRQKWSIVVLDFDLDTRSAVGRLIAGVLIQFAQFERELIGERTSDALRALAASGVKLGRPRTLSKTAQLRLFELRANGLSLVKIADQLNTEHVPTAHGGRWHASTVARILKAYAPKEAA
ncbi:recombinase family protein [Agromyces mediolanus]|uniref:Resolvase/invertase-type recombinase catalytic domain-containing protein n=1 Tax=Agromyces mediolanus TaxID=41986 RepID=A0A918FD56_AGRME|nr:recombinase family protein [Agromyces mediolanus]GGR28870.1 hypothetical protein GCM10010196_23420 [Agromyces mediolanus]GLJ72138.1 hypothetical protein GCM10017583_13940 [Agromyces mediolanus]